MIQGLEVCLRYDALGSAFPRAAVLVEGEGSLWDMIPEGARTFPDAPRQPSACLLGLDLSIHPVLN